MSQELENLEIGLRNTAWIEIQCFCFWIFEKFDKRKNDWTEKTQNLLFRTSPRVEKSSATSYCCSLRRPSSLRSRCRSDGRLRGIEGGNWPCFRVIVDQSIRIHGVSSGARVRSHVWVPWEFEVALKSPLREEVRFILVEGQIKRKDEEKRQVHQRHWFLYIFTDLRSRMTIKRYFFH